MNIAQIATTRRTCKAFDPARCDQHQKAREACKDKLGPEHRSCVLQQLNVK